MKTMFPGTYAVAEYWSSVPQSTCVGCGETKPSTLFPTMVSGNRRKRCTNCIEMRRAEIGNRRVPDHLRSDVEWNRPKFLQEKKTSV